MSQVYSFDCVAAYRSSLLPVPCCPVLIGCAAMFNQAEAIAVHGLELASKFAKVPASIHWLFWAHHCLDVKTLRSSSLRSSRSSR